MTDRPNKHFRLVLWAIHYRIHVGDEIPPEIEDAVDRWACQRCKLDYATFQEWKTRWRRHYDRMMAKRRHRREFWLFHGYIDRGRTPPDLTRNDQRQYNVPTYANYLRNQSRKTRRFWARLGFY